MRYFRFFALFAALFCILTSCETPQTIVNGITEREANEIIVFLKRYDIEASKISSAQSSTKEVLWDVQVESANTSRAMGILSKNGLPRQKSKTLLDVFGSGGMMASETDTKVKYQSGLAAEIAGMISKFDGVLDVDVKLSIPPAENQTEGQKPSVAVYVKHQGVLDDPNSHLISKIKRLVASSVNGVDIENVTVIGDRSRFSDDPLSEMNASALEDRKEYAKVWGVVLAKESILRFQVIFFTLSISIFVLFIALMWTLWKVYPLLQELGGFTALLRLKGSSEDKPAKDPSPPPEEKDLPKKDSAEEDS